MLSLEKIEYIRTKYLQGSKVRELSSEIGVTPRTIYNYLGRISTHEEDLFYEKLIVDYKKPPIGKDNVIPSLYYVAITLSREGKAKKEVIFPIYCFLAIMPLRSILLELNRKSFNPVEKKWNHHGTMIRMPADWSTLDLLNRIKL